MRAVVAAVRLILDRVGLGPTAKLEVTHADPAESLADLTYEEFAERAEQMAARIRAQADRAAAIEAEVVDGQIPKGIESKDSLSD